MIRSLKILFITTSHDKMGNTSTRTGIWLEEFAIPYYIFKEAGADIVVASPMGGPVPIDPKSQSTIAVTSGTKRFLKDEVGMELLKKSIRLEEINADDFDMVFLPGGHGPMWDLADNSTVKKLLEAFNNANKLIGAVCHGAAGLLSVQNDIGEWLVKGKKLTAFSNTEEASAGLTDIVPFLLETKLSLLGAVYSKGPNHVSHIVADGNIITGQNPASSEETAKKMITILRQHDYKNAARQPVISAA